MNAKLTCFKDFNFFVRERVRVRAYVDRTSKIVSDLAFLDQKTYISIYIMYFKVNECTHAFVRAPKVLKRKN